MRINLTVIRVFVCLLLLAGLLPECGKKDDHPSPAPSDATGCRLLGMETYAPLHKSGPGAPFTEEVKNYYTMDARGFVTEENDWTEDKYATTKSSSMSALISIQVDKDGFLTSVRNETEKVDSNGVNTKVTTKVSYTYDHGRLVGQVYEILAGATSSTGTFTYAYDNAGRLIKYTKPKGSVAYTYTNGQLTQANVTDAAGTVTTEEIQVDAAGRLTKITGPSYETRYTYDAEGSLVRQEDWANGKPQYGYTAEYDNRINPMNSIIDPPYKGFPNFSYLNLFPLTHSIHSLTRQTQLSPDAGGAAFVPQEIDTYINQYNNQNYIVAATDSLLSANGDPTGYVTTTRFVYTGCH